MPSDLPQHEVVRANMREDGLRLLRGTHARRVAPEQLEVLEGLTLRWHRPHRVAGAATADLQKNTITAAIVGTVPLFAGTNVPRHTNSSLALSARSSCDGSSAPRAVQCPRW